MTNNKLSKTIYCHLQHKCKPTVAPELPVPDNLITILDPSSKNIRIPWKVKNHENNIVVHVESHRMN